ncbi:MAG: peptidase [Euryarchaeota archaeon]|nr:peptidase [Euryarchaeota archaeon]
MSEIRVVIPDKVDRYIDSLVRTGMFSSKAELFRAALMEYLDKVSSVAKYYDSKIIFSPEGRIYQIEYAAEASLRGLCVAGLVFKEGIIFAHPEYEYRDADGKIIKDVEFNGKITKIDGYIITSSGLATDAEYLIGKIKEKRDHEDLVGEISKEYWKFTLSSNLRPLGTSLMIGIKNARKIVVFDPSGRYFYTKFWALGDGYKKIITQLNRKYTGDLDKEEAIKLMRDVLCSEKIVYEII